MSECLALREVGGLVGYGAAMAGGQLLFKTAGAAGGWRWSARRADRRLSAQRVLFRSAHSLRRADRSLWVWILSYTPLSRTYPFLALAFASRQRLVASVLPNRCDTARDRHCADLVLAFLPCGMSDG